MNREIIKRTWDEDGYVIIPHLFSSARIQELRDICDRILEQWIEESSDPEETANSTNMAFLTEPRYFEKHREQLKTLLEVIADETILNVLSCIIKDAPLFHNTQYFFNPATQTRGGDWHRDQQFGAPDEETEKARMHSTIGVHAHIALLADENLEYVSGSHARWDTPAELEIRRGLEGRNKNSSEMTEARRIKLNAGDAVFFSAWGIHRGNYIADKPRRTFDAIYGSSPGWYTPPPTCFLQPGVLDDLTPRTQQFFSKFIATYKDKWLAGDYDS